MPIVEQKTQPTERSHAEIARMNELLKEIKKENERRADLKAQVAEVEKSIAAKQAELDRLFITAQPTSVAVKKTNKKPTEAAKILAALAKNQNPGEMAKKILDILGASS